MPHRTLREAQVLEALGVDYVDESEVLTPADEAHHVWKQSFKVPFVCGCRDLGEALRRIAEGAAMIRTKARPAPATWWKPCGTCVQLWILSAGCKTCPRTSFPAWPRSLRWTWTFWSRPGTSAGFPWSTRRWGRGQSRRRRPDDAAWCRRSIRGLGHLQVQRPRQRGKAIVERVTHYNDPKIIAEVSRDLGEPMVSIGVRTLSEEQLLAPRGNL